VLTGRQRFPRHLVPELYVTNTFSTFEAIRNADFHTEFILEYGILQSAKCRQQSLLSTWLVFCYLALAAQVDVTVAANLAMFCFASSDCPKTSDFDNDPLHHGGHLRSSSRHEAIILWSTSAFSLSFSVKGRIRRTSHGLDNIERV
jgi:hypothetical protein